MELRQRTGLPMMECKKALDRRERRPRQGRGTAAHQERREGEQGRRARRGRRRRRHRGDARRENRRDGRAQLRDGLRREERRFPRVRERDRADRRARARRPTSRRFRRARSPPAKRSRPAASALVQKIGENITLRRFVRLDAQGRVASYVHGTRIGVLVDLHGRQRNARQGPRDAHRRDEAAGGRRANRCPPTSSRRSARSRPRAPPSRASLPTSSKRW